MVEEYVESENVENKKKVFARGNLDQFQAHSQKHFEREEKQRNI